MTRTSKEAWERAWVGHGDTGDTGGIWEGGQNGFRISLQQREREREVCEYYQRPYGCAYPSHFTTYTPYSNNTTHGDQGRMGAFIFSWAQAFISSLTGRSRSLYRTTNGKTCRSQSLRRPGTSTCVQHFIIRKIQTIRDRIE